MKIFLWSVLILLWCINYHIYQMFFAENKRKLYFVFSAILQAISIAVVIWILCPSYYAKNSFWVILDIPINLFAFYICSFLVSGIFCGIYKSIGHHYAEKINEKWHYNSLQFREDMEIVDAKIERIFYGSILYIIMIILIILNYI